MWPAPDRAAIEIISFETVPARLLWYAMQVHVSVGVRSGEHDMIWVDVVDSTVCFAVVREKSSWLYEIENETVANIRNLIRTCILFDRKYQSVGFHPDRAVNFHSPTATGHGTVATGYFQFNFWDIFIRYIWLALSFACGLNEWNGIMQGATLAVYHIAHIHNGLFMQPAKHIVWCYTHSTVLIACMSFVFLSFVRRGNIPTNNFGQQMSWNKHSRWPKKQKIWSKNNLWILNF